LAASLPARLRPLLLLHLAHALLRRPPLPLPLSLRPQLLPRPPPHPLPHLPHLLQRLLLPCRRVWALLPAASRQCSIGGWPRRIRSSRLTRLTLLALRLQSRPQRLPRPLHRRSRIAR
jgi:hypothetical protein